MNIQIDKIFQPQFLNLPSIVVILITVIANYEILKNMLYINI